MDTSARSCYDAGQRRALDRLARWLDAELLAGGGAAASGFFLPAGLVFSLVMLAVLVFTPVLVHALWTIGRRGWLLAFGVLSGLPALGAFASTSVSVRVLGMSAALVLYFALCAVLRPTVHQWREEQVWRARFLRADAEADAVG